MGILNKYEMVLCRSYLCNGNTCTVKMEVFILTHPGACFTGIFLRNLSRLQFLYFPLKIVTVMKFVKVILGMASIWSLCCCVHTPDTLRLADGQNSMVIFVMWFFNIESKYNTFSKIHISWRHWETYFSNVGKWQVFVKQVPFRHWDLPWTIKIWNLEKWLVFTLNRITKAFRGHHVIKKLFI